MPSAPAAVARSTSSAAYARLLLVGSRAYPRIPEFYSIELVASCKLIAAPLQCDLTSALSNKAVLRQ